MSFEVARSGSDRSVICAAQEPVVRAFTLWQCADLEVTAGRVIEVCRGYGVTPRQTSNPKVENALYGVGLGSLVESQPGDPLELSSTRTAPARGWT